MNVRVKVVQEIEYEFDPDPELDVAISDEELRVRIEDFFADQDFFVAGLVDDSSAAVWSLIPRESTVQVEILERTGDA